MDKLLSAGLYRLVRGWLFWAISVYAVLCGVLFGFSFRGGGLDDLTLMAFWIGFAVLISLSVGREHYENTVRNKAIAGHGHGTIILSEMLLHGGVCAAWAALCAVIAGLIGGTRYFAYFPWYITLFIAVGFVLCSVAVGILMTVICCLLTYRGVGPILCILLVIGLSLASYASASELGEEEFYVIVNVDENGEAAERVVSNPSYVKEPLRAMVRTAYYVNPFSLYNHMSSVDFYYIHGYRYETNDPYLVEDLRQYERAIVLTPLCMVGAIGTVGAVGYALFCRKDLK